MAPRLLPRPAIGIAQYQNTWSRNRVVWFFIRVTCIDAACSPPNNVASYVIAIIDLSKTGSLLYEDPKGHAGGALYDLWWWPMLDIGLRRGKYLLVAPGPGSA